MSSVFKLRGVNLRQLQVFVEVYQSGSITLAAKRLHLTQPTVSIQLKRLAEHLREPLYQVHNKKLVFTQSARLLVKAARDILASAERLEMALSDLHQIKAGKLKIALVSTAQYFVPKIIGPFCRQYPLVELQLNILNRDELLARLEHRQDDIYVLSQRPAQPPLHSKPFLDNPLCLIAPREHPLAQHPKLSLKDVINEPFILREKGSGTRQLIDQALARMGVTLDTRMEIQSNEAIKQCVANGLGLAILSEHAIRFGGMEDICILNVRELPIISHWQFVWPRDIEPSPVAQAFLDYLD